MLQFPTEQEILRKYPTLATPLQDAMESRYGFERIREIARKYSLIEEDVELVIQFVGLTMLGFLNPRDLGQELFNYMELRDKKTIDALDGELEQKILFPLKSELEKIYGYGQVSAEVKEKPRYEKPREVAPSTAPVLKPEEKRVELRFKPEARPSFAQAAEGKPAEAMKQPEAVPTSRKEAEMAPAPFIVDIGAVSQPKIETAPEKIAPMPPPIPQPAAPSGEAATPFMLRKETELKPILESVRPKISIPVTLQKREEATPIRVEITEEEAKKEPRSQVAKTAPPQGRIVHYVGPKTSLFPQSPVSPAAPSPTGHPQTGPGGTVGVGVPPPPIRPKIETPPPPPPTEEVIDLSSFRKVNPQSKKPQKESGPAIEGNVVDLR